MDIRWILMLVVWALVELYQKRKGTPQPKRMRKGALWATFTGWLLLYGAMQRGGSELIAFATAMAVPAVGMSIVYTVRVILNKIISKLIKGKSPRIRQARNGQHRFSVLGTANKKTPLMDNFLTNHVPDSHPCRP